MPHTKGHSDLARIVLPKLSAPDPVSGRTGKQDGQGTRIDSREERLFRSLDYDNDSAILRRDFEAVLNEIGLSKGDRRLHQSIQALDGYAEQMRLPEEDDPASKIPRRIFCDAVRQNILLVEKALQGQMVIPDFKAFCRDIKDVYESILSNRTGKAADYIPQLDLPGPEVDRFGLSLCTVDGQRYSVGDSRQHFSVQSISKAINYCLALEEHGPEYVHRFVGHEPSGSAFNELSLNKQHQPHNPMINAGGIMSCALIKLSEKRASDKAGHSGDLAARGFSGARFDYVMERWRALCGDDAPRFSTSVFLSERETADRNFALAYFMREKRAFPEGVDLHDVLEFYLQCCAIEANTELMSAVAATLANGGICPVTGERVFKAETVRYCLTLMSSCGLYDFSGEFAFAVGLPGKSGVSGAIMVVVPNVMGFCTWSPRLDALGNSVRGIHFFRRLVDRFNLHNFDSVTGSSGKKDPRLNPIQQKARLVNEMILAASKGDLGALQDQVRRGSELACQDYDMRTPLHLAAAENQTRVVKYFIAEAARDPVSVDLNPVDRWGGTPLDDAHLHGNQEIVHLLEQAGARRGRGRRQIVTAATARSSLHSADPLKTGELIWAASAGDLAAVRRLVAQGVPLDCADYDHRTAMHLAAAEGHREVILYFLAHGANANPTDRWGATPLDEARRHGQDEIAALLEESGGRSRTAGKPAATGPFALSGEGKVAACPG
jgi:glutaminase